MGLLMILITISTVVLLSTKKLMLRIRMLVVR
ncbi:sortase B protein-sorting domain-containing protein [Psychrobacter sp.]